MSKKKAIILAICSLIAGVFCGGLPPALALASYMKMTSQEEKARSYREPWIDLDALGKIRGGDTNSAIQFLEGQLDTALLEIWMRNKDIPVEKRDPHLLQMLADVRDYRSSFPRTRKNPELDQMIAEVLSWGNYQPSR